MLIYSEPFTPSIFSKSFQNDETKQIILKRLHLTEDSLLNHAIFLDIETTGLSAKSSFLYMIGVIYYHEQSFHYKQWFLENSSEEKKVLELVSQFLSSYHTIIHFNGTTFDLPYLIQKFERYQLPFSFDTFQSIDLYRTLKPLKNILKLPNCKQKSFEDALNITRQDCFDGGMLIEIYHDYLKKKKAESLHFLLLHNKEDIIHMLDLCSLIPYLDFLDVSFLENVNLTISATLEKTKALDKTERYELHIILKTIAYYPILFHYQTDLFQLILQSGSLHLLVSNPTMEFKNYYPDYKNYYYLPEEDTAIHKSVSSYVDKSHRIKATKDNCYSRFLCNEQFLSNTNALIAYTKNILKSRL